ncbi:MAG: hypothetical protein II997_08540 [Clostridia bacterium]|nr:hypothetical protein [Clostridia bacterium]
MSEICVECFEKITGERNIEKNFIISDELDLCEECGEFKHVIIAEKGFPMLFIRLFLFPFKLIYHIFYGLLSFFLSLPKICKNKKVNKREEEPK